MREWVLALGPVAAIVYFVMYPHQLKALMDWAAALLL